MPRIRCFMLEPTERVQQKLRRYSRSNDCPDGAYHDAGVVIEPVAAIFNERGALTNGSSQDSWPHDDPRWPVQCSCGYAFQEQDAWQLFCELIYRRIDTGEEMTLRDASPGAMWYASWLDQFHQPQDEHNLVVKLPDNSDWCVDSQANNCTIADDVSQKKHHCWPRRGAPPDVDVNKSYGPTCQAGAGSIQSHAWHGFLRNGWLEG